MIVFKVLIYLCAIALIAGIILFLVFPAWIKDTKKQEKCIKTSAICLLISTLLGFSLGMIALAFTCEGITVTI